MSVEWKDVVFNRKTDPDETGASIVGFRLFPVTGRRIELLEGPDGKLLPVPLEITEKESKELLRRCGGVRVVEVY